MSPYEQSEAEQEAARRAEAYQAAWKMICEAQKAFIEGGTCAEDALEAAMALYFHTHPNLPPDACQ